MALNASHVFVPLPIPPAPNPADYTEFSDLAAAILPAAEAALDQAGADLADLAAAAYAGAGAMDALGLDLAAAADELASLVAETEAGDPGPAASDAEAWQTGFESAVDEVGANVGQGPISVYVPGYPTQEFPTP